MALVFSTQAPSTWPDFAKKSLTFQPIYPHLRPSVKRNGPRCVRPSPALHAARAIARFCHVQWAHLDSSAELTWNAQAAIEHRSPVAVVFRVNIARWYLGSGPTWEYPPTETSTPIQPINPTATAIKDGIALYAQPDHTTWLWGFSVHRSTTASFTAAAANCIMIGHTPNATAFRWIDTPIPKIQHYYRLRAFTWDGVLGAQSDEVSATPL